MKKQPWLKWALILLACGIFLTTILYFLLDSWQEPLRMNQEARQDAPGQFIRLSDGITHYRFAGPENGELLVLIHGGMVSGMFAWKHNYEYLTDKGFRILMYDLYGRGYSERVKEEYTPELYFNQFEELLDSLQIEEPINLAGLSLGSMVAIEYTRRHPKKVDKLMLLSPAARGKFNLRFVFKIPLVSDFLMAAYWFPRAVDNQMEEFYKPVNFPEYRKRLEEMIRYKGYKSSNYSTWINTLTYNMEPQIRKIGEQGTPVALVLGEHDPYVTAEEAKVYQALLPNLKVFTVEEAGHVVNYEQPEEVNKMMYQFFSSQENKEPGNYATTSVSTNP